MSLIAISLFVMLGLTIFSVISGNSFVANVVSVEYSGIADIDSVPSYFEIDPTAEGFYIDPLIGAIGILLVIIVIAGAIGLRILGSGLSDSGHRIATLATIYAGMWILLSTLASPMIFGISTVGSIIYITFTIFYVIGVIKKLGEG